MHEPSPTRLATDFSLMGDIMAVCIRFINRELVHNVLQQLYQVLSPITGALHLDHVPIHVSASGRVDEVESDTHTFAMMISQPLNGVINAHIKITGVLGLNMNRSLLLPTSGAVISFCGVFLTCEEMVVRVAIERISVLAPPRTVQMSDRHSRRSRTYAS